MRPLADADRQRLVTAMAEIRKTLTGQPPSSAGSGGAPQPPAQLSLRRHRPGDIGWMISLHGELY